MTSLSPNTSSSFHGLSLEDAYSQLDAEISRLEVQLSSLKTIRNSLAPVSKIPTDIFSEIFQHLYDDSSSPFHDDIGVNRRFFVSWVCRQWRQAAIATPILWTTISKKTAGGRCTVRVDLVEELLTRSRGLGLAVNLMKPSLAVLKLCLAEMARMQHLRLASLPPSYREKLKTFLSQPAPLLTSLELQDSNSSPPPFSGNYPHLRHLAIRCSFIRTPSPLLVTTLTSLHIHDAPAHFTIGDLIGQLALLPNMLELVIVDSLQADVAVLPPRLSHPSLQTLTISGTRINIVFGFLGCLDIPQALITTKWAPVFDPLAEEISMAFDEYQSRVPFQIHHLSVLSSPHTSCLNLRVSNTSQQHRHSLEFPDEQRDDDLIDALCSQLSFENIQYLATDGFSDGLFEQAMTSDTLKTLIAYGKDALDDVVNALGRIPETEEELLLTAMKELTIYGVDGNSDGIDHLMNVLCMRHTMEFGVTQLIFAKCPNVDADRFRNFVDVVSVVDILE